MRSQTIAPVRRSVQTEHRTDFACFQHPFLPAEAWSEVTSARLSDTGAQASLVCRFVCAARDRCPVQMGVETIAAGGWYDQHGEFIQPNPDEFELKQAAAYIGVNSSRLRAICSERGIKRTRVVRQVSFLHEKDVRKLAREYGPPHGTKRAFIVHEIRGESLCHECSELLTLSS